ncbi:hypothetical protein J0H58_16835 [bacterium]|nr:hypothetical protein [bacterium]
MVAAAAAACYGLAEWLGTPAFAAIWVATTGAGCALGAALLRTSEIGRVTWRNRAAGYLIPWGWRLNRGRLWPVPLISWAVWAAIGGAVFLLRSGPAEEQPGLRIALFAAWVVDAAALLFVLGSIRQATPGSRVGSLWRLTAILAGLILTSVGLYLGGMTLAALAVGGGPPAVVGGCALLFVGLVVTIGRNARWN